MLAIGPITQVSVDSTSSQLSCAAPSGGTGPYTQQWYRDTVTGFTPGAGNLITGATALTLDDEDLIPNTKYFYVVKVTDTGNGDATADSAQLGVVTAPPVIQPNAFGPVPYLATLDQAPGPNTKSCILDTAVVGPVYAGCAVKQVNPTVPNPPGYNGPITVTPCTSDDDEVFGFIWYSMKDISFGGGSLVEVAGALDVIYLYATASGNVTDACVLDLSTNGGVQPVGSSGNNIVGNFLDQPVIGQLVRVQLDTPSHRFVA